MHGHDHPRPKGNHPEANIEEKKKTNVCLLVIAILIPNIGGWIGAGFTATNLGDWFETLEHPVWRPPNWLFAPVWTVLYCLMGAASYLVYRDGTGCCGKFTPLLFYCLQLLVNWSWTPIFFLANNILGALVVIAALWVLVLVTIILFFRVNRWTGLLLCPYILWVSVATALNANYYILNKD